MFTKAEFPPGHFTVKTDREKFLSLVIDISVLSKANNKSSIKIRHKIFNCFEKLGGDEEEGKIFSVWGKTNFPFKKLKYI